MLLFHAISSYLVDRYMTHEPMLFSQVANAYICRQIATLFAHPVVTDLYAYFWTGFC